MIPPLSEFLVDGTKNTSLDDFPTTPPSAFKGKSSAEKRIQSNLNKLERLQYQLFASAQHSVLIILQSTDASGKDGLIRHVLSGLNPQGCKVHSFRKPSSLELRHDWMWRHYKCLPERGMIGVFNRSYYENVLATQVHPEWILNENIPGIQSVKDIGESFWNHRYQDINHFEDMLTRNGTLILKFFLHLSKEEQARRFISRIDETGKNWKISLSDFTERNFWDDYQTAFEKMLNLTSTKSCPWYIIPADQKWFSRTLVSDILTQRLGEIPFKMPDIDPKVKNELQVLREQLSH
ncbi:MAG: polyphosphate kinase 2 family protein [Cytophagales bacterium]|nr:polyphosphate kinase 2 family protein [Cytophagales bacterium]